MNLHAVHPDTVHRGALCGAATRMFAPSGHARMIAYRTVSDDEADALVARGARICLSCERLRAYLDVPDETP